MKNVPKTDNLLIAILLFLGVGGLVGGISFITSPDGSGLGMTTELLARAPVHDYFWPGIFLLFFMCAWPFINIYGLLSKRDWATISLCLLGIVTMVWIAYETIVIRTFSPLQPTIFIAGALVILGALKRKTIP